ncbi:TetR/AcrR family transcriptional regulator [Phyllobacterium sophorae]|uniref:TetR/AcrR family transcriptional regulator n=1 Tax=Phyllobacterium sophorae TaxID=1520277 RepID=A0A2P7B6M6_9HYPH|nr:TetR/AcrR family transcriptional regulator [Phyllobacterium sophorae]PSH62127.1 TetR/AcrR family transcriptional regulator [Phyllobacterium sophorae]
MAGIQDARRSALENELGPRARRKAQRPQEILQAAFEEFVERGYTATRIEDVATRAGVTKGTIYLYFQNKEELFQEVVGKLSQPIFDEKQFMEQHQHRSCDELVRLFLDTLYQHMTVNPHSREILRFLIADGRSFPTLVSTYFDQFVQPLMTMFDRILQKGVREGVFEIWAEGHISQILVSPALTYTIDTLLSPDTKLPELKIYVNTHYEMVMRTIGKAPA